MAGSDIHRALSFDNLHFFDGGLWAAHLSKLLNDRLKETAGVDGITVVDDRYVSFLAPVLAGLLRLTSQIQLQYATALARS